jgi:hypothetical protein
VVTPAEQDQVSQRAEAAAGIEPGMTVQDLGFDEDAVDGALRDEIVAIAVAGAEQDGSTSPTSTTWWRTSS